MSNSTVVSKPPQPESERLLDIIKKETASYVDLTWNHKKRPVVSDHNRIETIIDYTFDSVKRSFHDEKVTYAKIQNADAHIALNAIREMFKYRQIKDGQVTIKLSTQGFSEIEELIKKVR